MNIINNIIHLLFTVLKIDKNSKQLVDFATIHSRTKTCEPLKLPLLIGYELGAYNYYLIYWGL